MRLKEPIFTDLAAVKVLSGDVASRNKTFVDVALEVVIQIPVTSLNCFGEQAVWPPANTVGSDNLRITPDEIKKPL